VLEEEVEDWRDAKLGREGFVVFASIFKLEFVVNWIGF
jgi:hypothetical protein